MANPLVERDFPIAPQDIDVDVLERVPSSKELVDPQAAARVVRWMQQRGRWGSCSTAELVRLVPAHSRLLHCRGILDYSLGRRVALASKKEEPDCYFVTASFVLECFYVTLAYRVNFKSRLCRAPAIS